MSNEFSLPPSGSPLPSVQANPASPLPPIPKDLPPIPVNLPPIPKDLPPILGQETPRKIHPSLFVSPHSRQSILMPEELERFGNLLVFARSVVEGYFAGKHRSPYRGSSVEFADYKEYVPGDDIKRIEWRAYGRSRKLFLRQYEAETDMVVYLMVDVSESMNYFGTDRQSKYVLAAKIAAALAYLMINQGDKVSLTLFAEKVHHFLPPGGTRFHLHTLVRSLELVRSAFETDTTKALIECSSFFKKRGRLVVLSDFWDNSEPIFEALSRFLHRKFEILLLQVVNPHELDLHAVHTARFHDMETRESIEVEPEDIREAYRESARQWVDKVAREAHSRGISHAVVRTDRPYLDAIEAYMGFRGRNTFSIL